MRKPAAGPRVEVETVTRRWYVSRVVPGLKTTSEERGRVIQWADANPRVWQVVKTNKSAPFGASSSVYMGCDRGPTTDQLLARAATFYGELTRPADDFPQVAAQFTFDYFLDPGFRGGFFRQHDGEYYRGCAHLDYTPALLEEVVDRFLTWCEGSPLYHRTQFVEVDGKIIRGDGSGVVGRRTRGER